MKIYSLPVGMIGTNCYLVVNDETKEGFIVDPGGDDKVIAKRLNEYGIKPTAILLTHGHFDHIMAVNELRENYPDIKVYASAQEQELLSDPVMNSSMGLIRNPYTTTADIGVCDGDKLEIAGIEVEVIATPGHTRGGVCYYISKFKKLFSGDTLFCESYGRTDLPTGNAHLLFESINKLFERLPDETAVYPGHGDATSIGYEKRNNPMREE